MAAAKPISCAACGSAPAPTESGLPSSTSKVWIMSTGLSHGLIQRSELVLPTEEDASRHSKEPKEFMKLYKKATKATRAFQQVGL
ncbi:hypothetical protein ACP70R_020563 [Stipagrostis hirtigluma subsp. patula]